MPRLALYSDIHLELDAKHGREPWQPPELDVDLVLLAGDIGAHTHGLAWAAQTFSRWRRPPHVAYVAGNHEYYDAGLGLLAELRKPAWKGVTFLERSTLEVPGVRALGCTLWSGFDLYGAEFRTESMNAAKMGIQDFERIRGRGGRLLEPQDVLRLHRTAVTWLDAELSKPWSGATVVMTHFAPHPACVPPRFKGSPWSPFFVSDLRSLMEEHRPAVWAFGHTHFNIDMIVEGGTRLVSNQRGYAKETPGIGFQEALVMEV